MFKSGTIDLWITVSLICFGSSFVVGYHLGVLNLLQIPIKAFLSTTILNEPFNEDEQNKKFFNPTFLYGLVGAIFVFFAAIGALSCSWFGDRLGRRNSLLINHIFLFIGCMICGFCEIAKSSVPLFIGRGFIGINCGVSMGLASVYLAEISPTDIRGLVTACHQLAITMGILFSYLITMKDVMNHPMIWPWSITVSAVPAVISLVSLPFYPESPRFLFLHKRKELEASKAYMQYNSTGDLNDFIDEMKTAQDKASKQVKFRFLQLFSDKQYRLALLITVLFQICQQLSGINAVITYSSTILSSAGIPIEYNEYCVIGFGVFNVALTVVALPLLERMGRRKMVLFPTAILMLSLGILTITVNISASSEHTQTTKITGIISALLIATFILGFALGLGPIAGLIANELFGQSPRAAAQSFGQAIQWTCNLIVLFTFPSLDQLIKGYVFIIFLCVVFPCFVFFLLFMPETKGQTFEATAERLTEFRIVWRRQRGPTNETALDNLDQEK